jgi:RAMA domain-containing protein
MSKRSPDLLLGFLEQVSWRVLDEYRDILRTLIRRKCGIYVLYKHDKLYYVGLAGNLMGRVNGHLKDRHRGAWDRFSVYLTSNEAHIKPLESLLLRIARPSGNRVSGGFGRPINLYRSLHRAMSDADADRRARILGGHVARRLRRRRTRDARGSLVLAGLVDRRLALRGRLKQRRFKATLRRDGYISFNGRKYDSPSAAAAKAVGHAANGWIFWHYRLAPRKWVSLGHLRR